MADRSSIESILASLESSPWRGRAFRVMVYDYPPDRENTVGARWNPPETAAIYMCLEPEVCIAEVEYGLRRQPRPVKTGIPRTLYEIDVELSTVVNLESALDDLNEIGIGRAQLFADDMKVSQEIGRVVTWLGCDGLLVPSARKAGTNLVIYPGRATESYKYEVIGGKPL
jgi:RES domain-containing protein